MEVRQRSEKATSRIEMTMTTTKMKVDGRDRARPKQNILDSFPPAERPEFARETENSRAVMNGLELASFLASSHAPVGGDSLLLRAMPPAGVTKVVVVVVVEILAW